MTNIDAIAGSTPLETEPGFGKPVAVPRRGWRNQIVGAVLPATELATAGAVCAIGELVFRATGFVTAISPASVLLPALVIAALYRLLGHDDRFRSSPVELFRARVLAALIGAGFFVVTLPPLPLAMLWVMWLSMAALFVVAGSLTAAIAKGALIGLGLWKVPAVLIGDAVATEHLASILSADPAAAFAPVGQIGVDALGEEAARTALPGHPEMALLVSFGNLADDLRTAAKINLPTITIMPVAAVLSTLWLHPRAVGTALGIDLIRAGPGNADRLLKRAVDLAVAVPAAVFTLPIVLVLAAAIWCIDRGNPFYAQIRVGLNGHPIHVWKLRSMYRDAEFRLEGLLAADPIARAEWESHFKLRRDPRILPHIGQFVRRSSLDELPQLWNVLRGDMSVVGPRPFPGYHLAAFDAEFLALRRSVVPGLTGVWQISARSDGDLAVQRRLDTFYIRNWSIWLDLYVLFNTLPAVLSLRGAR